MSAPGELKKSELTLVQGPDSYLSKPTARAYKRAMKDLRRDYPHAGIVEAPARKGSGAYRTATVQNDMANASRYGGTAEKQRWNLSTASTVPLAYHPNGSHERGTAFDLSGAPLTAHVISVLGKYGFRRTLAGDPNHFGHDGKTATSILPSKKTYYLVVEGDTLGKIAKKFKTTVPKLVSLNKIKNPDLIRVGERLRVK